MTKNKSLSSIMIFCCMMLLTACYESSENNHLKFKMIKAEKSISITNEKGAPSCSVNLEIAGADEQQGEAAKKINATIVEELLNMTEVTLQQAADSFANRYTKEYKQNMGPLYREDRNDPAKRPWYEYHYNITSETEAGSDGVTVYKAYLDYYEGGAHGINQTLCMNFDNQTGRLLTLTDVFVPGFEQQLNEKLLKALMEEQDASSINELQNKGFLFATDMYAPENFILGKDAITFIFNAYEIAPYAMGITELTLNIDELEDILKK